MFADVLEMTEDRDVCFRLVRPPWCLMNILGLYWLAAVILHHLENDMVLLRSEKKCIKKGDGVGMG